MSRMTPNQAHVRYTAEQYDDYTKEFVKPYDDMLAAWVLQESRKLPAAFTLLDVGTGTARFLIHLASIPELDAVRLIGTDAFDDMIQTGSAAIGNAGFANRIELILDTVHNMKLPSNLAHLIVSRSTLHHWKDATFPDPVPRALQEIFRVLKPGGMALIVDVRRDAPPEAVEKFNTQRRQAGIGDSFLGEKFTVAEVQAFAETAGIGSYCTVEAGKSGLSLLGLALVIKKPLDL